MTQFFARSGLFGDLLGDAAVSQAFDAPAFVARMLAFERAWTIALRDAGALEPDAAAEALTAIEGFGGQIDPVACARDGLPVPAMVRALRAGLSDAGAAAVHTGATSQDVIDTAMVLTLSTVLDDLRARLEAVERALRDMEARFGAAPLMARTRMQAALPATAALRIGAWRRPLRDHLARGAVLRDELAVVQIGGAIGTRTGEAAICAEPVARALGLTPGDVWHSDRSRMIAMGHWLTLVAGSLGKIGQDCALMAQQGIDEIVIAGGGGSSAMPHKENPILAETMVTLARYVAGQNGVLGQALIHEQERSGSAWALEWMVLPAMAEATGAALRHAETLVNSVTRVGSA